jgi:hypothetical protein
MKFYRDFNSRIFRISKLNNCWDHFYLDSQNFLGYKQHLGYSALDVIYTLYINTIKKIKKIPLSQETVGMHGED